MGIKFVGKRETPSGTYEVYRGDDAISARGFLESREVNQRLYYITVETPEGNWGIDIEGLYLGQLLPFQLEIHSAKYEGAVCGVPAMSSLTFAAKGMADNFVVSVLCGKCGHRWNDGIRFKNLTVVRCPRCKSLNKIDSSPNIEVFGETLLFNVSVTPGAPVENQAGMEPLPTGPVNQGRLIKSLVTPNS